jgi:Flp pilus assembly protein TadG
MMGFICRFRHDERGNAAVEFALIIPFLITLYFGSLEGGAAFMADKRINSISATIGDLVGQWDPANDGTAPNHYLTTGTGGTLQGYFTAATGILAPYPTTGVKIVVSLVWVKSDGTSKVIWSKSNDSVNAPPRTQGASFGPLYKTGTTPTEMNITAQGGCVIASEVSYSYKPLLGVVFNTTLNLSHTNYFIPRYGATNTIKVDTPTVASTSCTTGVY